MLGKKNQPPKLANMRKPQVRPMVLMRPILAFYTHNHLLGLAEKYFASLLEPFESAQLPCMLDICRYSNLDSLSQGATPPEVVEKLLTTTKSTLTLYLPSDYSLSLEIQAPFQFSHTTYQWIPPFTLKTSSISSSDGEISFDALSDAESPITLIVEESLSSVTGEILGGQWRKIEMREFDRSGRRIRVELRGQDHMGKIIVVDGSEQIDCVDRSLRDILLGITGSV